MRLNSVNKETLSRLRLIRFYVPTALSCIAIHLSLCVFAYADNCPASYKVTELFPPPGFISTFATAINVKGAITGYAITENQAVGVIWNSRGQILDTISGSEGLKFYPRAINSYLTTGGSVELPNGTSKAWIKRFGQRVHILDSHGWDETVITGIADNDQVAGTYWKAGNAGSGAFAIEPFGELKFLRKLSSDSRWDYAEAMNNKGEIVGSSLKSLSESRQVARGVIWSSINTINSIDPPPHVNGPTWEYSHALAISSARSVTGLFLSNDTRQGIFFLYHPFLWTSEQGFKEIRFGPPGQEDHDFVGLGINAKNTIVGHVYDYDDGSAFIWKSCLETQFLDSVADLGERWSHLISADAINDLDMIVGSGRVEEFDELGERIQRGFVLTPR